MKVVFRADASVKIGSGHVMRCLTLADELTRQEHECEFICREHEGHLGESISGKGYQLTMLPAGGDTELAVYSEDDGSYADWLDVPWEQDAQQTQEAVEPLKADWLVVDHYALDARWEHRVASAVERILVIDDLADRHHECQLLLDQNLGRAASHYDGLVPKDCLRLIGPEYALLRPEFSDLRDRSLKRRENPELKRILISLGGVDQTNVTGKVLEALSAITLPEGLQLDIIMGASAPYLDEVRQQTALLPCKATVNVNVPDIAERMCLADLSIGAAGSTSWERCCLGLPSATIIVADNQRLIGEALAQSGVAFLIQGGRILEDIRTLFTRFEHSTEDFQTSANNAAAVCDGGGTARVVSMLTGGGQA